MVAGPIRNFVRGVGFDHQTTNLSPNRMANWVLASHHSRGGRFHVRRQRLWDQIDDLSNGGFLAHRNPKESEDEPEILRPTHAGAS